MFNVCASHNSNSKKIGLKIHACKTKLIRDRNTTSRPVEIHGKEIEEVEVFTYLGSKVLADGDSQVEVQAHLSKVRYAFASLRTVWKA